MSFSFDSASVQGAVIKVIGVGGGGGNAINRMIEEGLAGVEFIAANTDIQALSSSKAETVIQLGPKLTRGLGAGGQPEVGQSSLKKVKKHLQKHLQELIWSLSLLVWVVALVQGSTSYCTYCEKFGCIDSCSCDTSIWI